MRLPLFFLTCLMFSTPHVVVGHDYGKALKLSLLFYKAQRSGKLPDAEVPWRKSAFTNDKTTDGKDMTGGFFDAGDYVRFMLPQATSITTLAHGMLEFKQGYVKSGQYQRGLQVLGWGADFLAKCVISPTRLVAQIGNGGADHSTWTRPDEITAPYPVYELSPQKPGADLAGSMAAALAASSKVFEAAGDAVRSKKYLRAAQDAFNFGLRYPGLYSMSVPDAAAFYKSSSQYDDMALGAVWLFRATGNATYSKLAQQLFDKSVGTEGVGWPAHDWDGQLYMTAMHLARVAPNEKYNKLLQRFEAAWYTGGGGAVQKTPKGLMWLAPWGALRHNANAMFVLLTRAQGDAKAMQKAYCFAKGQVGYMLGDRGQSYVVGYGARYPTQPHHRAASCPSPPARCGWDWFNRRQANPQVLLGALVGGPNVKDEYEDARSDYIRNEVTIDYQAGFTGALAALLSNDGKTAC